MKGGLNTGERLSVKRKEIVWESAEVREEGGDFMRISWVLMSLGSEACRDTGAPAVSPESQPEWLPRRE